MIATISLILIGLAVLVIYVFNFREGEPKAQSTNNTSVSEEKKSKIAEAPKLTETPNKFLGKKACDIFSQSIADTIVGQGAKKNEPAMFQKDFATVTSCQYVNSISDATVTLYRYFNEDSAKKYLDLVKKQSFITEQKNEFIIAVDFKISAQRSEVKSKELMVEITKKI